MINLIKSKKKILKLNDIVLIPEFEKLLKMDEAVIERITASLKEEGFKPGHELHIWYNNGQYILIDGHTRRYCCEKAGLVKVPCIIHYFSTIEEAKAFAIREQTNRRNMSGAALLEAVQKIDFRKEKTNSSTEKGKSSEIIAKQLGISSRSVEKARTILEHGTESQKQAVLQNERSINQVYNEIKSPSKFEMKTDSLSTKDKYFVYGLYYAVRNHVADEEMIKNIVADKELLLEIGNKIKNFNFESAATMDNL